MELPQLQYCIGLHAIWLGPGPWRQAPTPGEHMLSPELSEGRGDWAAGVALVLWSAVANYAVAPDPARPWILETSPNTR